MTPIKDVFDEQLDRIAQRLEKVERRYQRRCRKRREANRATLQDMDANMLVGSIAGTSHMGNRRPTLDQLDLERQS